MGRRSDSSLADLHAADTQQTRRRRGREAARAAVAESVGAQWLRRCEVRRAPGTRGSRLQASLTGQATTTERLSGVSRVEGDVLKIDRGPVDNIDGRVCGQDKRRWAREGHFQARIFLKWCSNKKPDQPTLLARTSHHANSLAQVPSSPPGPG